MSGTPIKGKKRETADASKGEPFVPQKPAPVITQAEETRPPRAVPVIVRCKDCFWGQDRGVGFRRCRGGTPASQYRNVTGWAGAIHADAMWPKVNDDDYCGSGIPLP